MLFIQGNVSYLYQLMHLRVALRVLDESEKL